MHVPAVPNQNGPATQVASKIAEKLQDMRRSDVLFVNRKEQTQTTTAGRNGQSAQHRQSIVAIPRAGDRCLSLRCPGSPQQGLQHEPAFIEKHQGTAGGARLFLSGANRVPATARPPLRPARALVAPAFEPSIPGRVRSSKRGTNDSSRQSAAGSVWPRGHTSTNWFRNRLPADPASTTRPVCAAAFATTAAVCPDEAWRPGHSSRSSQPRPSSVLRRTTTLR